MKKLLFPLLALALSIGTASAQDERPGRERPNPEEQAARQSERLTKELGLSADQAARIKEIDLERAKEMQAGRGQGKPSGSRNEMEAKMQADRSKYDARYKEVLTADQYAKYSQLAASRPGPGGKGPEGKDGKLKAKNGKVKIKTTDN
jgi:Spy/CpxP family protein refolding chaperone